MFQHVSSNCINFKIWSSNFGWYTARPQTALKLIDRDGFCGQLGTPLCMSQQEGGKEINNELNRCSCHQLAERNPSILPPISVKDHKDLKLLRVGEHIYTVSMIAIFLPSKSHSMLLIGSCFGVKVGTLWNKIKLALQKLSFVPQPDQPKLVSF